MPRAKSDSVQLAVRVPREWLAKLDTCAAAMARSIQPFDFSFTRTDALRAALLSGMDRILADAAIAEAPKKKARSPKGTRS